MQIQIDQPERSAEEVDVNIHGRRQDSGTDLAERENWNADELGEQSSYEGTTEMDRRLRRGNEAAGDPNARDVAGAVSPKDAPPARELGRQLPPTAKEEPNE